MGQLLQVLPRLRSRSPSESAASGNVKNYPCSIQQMRENHAAWAILNPPRNSRVTFRGGRGGTKLQSWRHLSSGFAAANAQLVHALLWFRNLDGLVYSEAVRHDLFATGGPIDFDAIDLL